MGVKQSFRNYLYNFAMFEGRSTLLGTAQQPEAKGVFEWSGGTGIAAADGGTADVGYGVGNGVRFQSHPMTVDGQEVYALDLQFTNPHLVVTSSTEAELRMDVAGYTFESMTEVGDPYSMEDATIASLAITPDTLSVSDGIVTGTSIPATLTEEGS